MTENIIIAIITGIVSSLGSILAFITSEKSRRLKTEESHRAELKETEQAIQNNLDTTREDCIKTINQMKVHMDGMRDEYLKRIDDIEDNITDLKAEYQSKTAVIELQISSLEKKQEVHNNLISRTYQLEAGQKLQEEQIKVANHRIEDLERKAP